MILHRRGVTSPAGDQRAEKVAAARRRRREAKKERKRTAATAQQDVLAEAGDEVMPQVTGAPPTTSPPSPEPAHPAAAASDASDAAVLYVDQWDYESQPRARLSRTPHEDGQARAAAAQAGVAPVELQLRPAYPVGTKVIIVDTDEEENGKWGSPLTPRSAA